MKRRTTAILVAAALFSLADRCAASEGERILDFDARIAVREDGSIGVTETIAVAAAGDDIKHGIFRDFPTVYDGPYWTRVEVPFRVVDVERDGRPEPYRLATRDNGVRVYVGKEEELLRPGGYAYRLRYETAEQLGFFPDHDELYWNVTGNGWIFPIDRATATVELPAEIPREHIRLAGYTGSAGSRAHALRARIDSASGTLRFETTRPLGAYEGLTIVASFPKGFIREPTQAARRDRFFRDNRIIAVGAGGLALVLLYYAIAWLLVGRDPARGTIIPLFEPPLGLAPACLRYVREMAYDQRCFASALVSLAVKGAIRIDEKDGDYTLVKSAGKGAPLSLGERQVASQLLSSGSLRLESKNHAKVKGAIRALRDALSLEYDGKLFLANRRWLIPGLVLSALSVLGAGLCGRTEQVVGFIFMTFWLSGWTLGTFSVARVAAGAWMAVFLPSGAFARVGALFTAVFSSLFAVPMLFGEGFGLFMLAKSSSYWMVPIVAALIGLAFLFHQLLKRPTAAGRKVMDDIDGFRMYLETAEGEEIARIAAPPKTPELFEKLLPYAIALGVESAWAEKFQGVLAAAGRDGGANYAPLWYSGNSWSRVGSSAFVGSLGSSLSGAIASSSTAPGSSSGSGGGGSAGGGGGGGGGGGW